MAYMGNWYRDDIVVLKHGEPTVNSAAALR